MGAFVFRQKGSSCIYGRGAQAPKCPFNMEDPAPYLGNVCDGTHRGDPAHLLAICISCNFPPSTTTRGIFADYQPE